MMFQTPLRWNNAESSWVRATFGLHAIGDQAPYCSLTGEEYAHNRVRERELLSCGMLHAPIKRVFPKLKPFAFWHLCTDGIPMHYIANALYWHDMANGVVERRQYDPDPRVTFASHCLLGVLPSDEPVDVLIDRCTRSYVEAWLGDRVPGLQKLYQEQVVSQLERIAAELGAVQVQP